MVYGAGWMLHFALLTEPGPGNAWGAPTGDVWRDTLRVHQQMLTANHGRTTSHPLGFATALLRLARVPRVLFLYRDLLALLFARCAFVLRLDHTGWTRPGPCHARRARARAAAAALVPGFLAIRPLGLFRGRR